MSAPDAWVFHLVEQVPGEHGPAMASLGRWLRDRHHLTADVAVQLAVELLAVESDETCCTVRALLGDGWSAGVGELVAAARKL